LGGKLINPVQFVQDFELDIYSVHPHYQLIEKEDIQALRLNGQHTFVWTVNQTSSMQQLIDAGVSGIMSDYPDRLRKLLL